MTQTRTKHLHQPAVHRLPAIKTGIAAAVAATLAMLMSMPASASPFFVPGNLVVSVEGNGVYGATSGSYTDNQASPLTLFQFQTNGTSSASYVNAMVLPQTSSGKNSAVSAEYGSSSEGMLQLSGDGKYLTIMGYGINAATFNANPTQYGTAVNDPTKPNALAQSGSMTNQSAYTPIARVVALIDAAGTVDSSTTLYNVFNGNNPRSAYTMDGSSFYVSGQGVSGDKTGGVFYATKGSSSATAITGLDTDSHASAQDTRIVQVYNGQLYVSADSKQGSGSNRDFIGTLGAPGALPTSQANSGNGPAQLNGFGNSGGTGKLTITATNGNGINTKDLVVNLSPESYYFANASTLYVADSGIPKNDSAAVKNGPAITVGDGGLQKWVNSKTDGSGTWVLVYTLSTGLNLVKNDAASGTTGLLGLTGKTLDDGEVQLFATNYTIGDTDSTFLFGITDLLSASVKASDEAFTLLASAPADSTFKGVSFAPSSVPEPASGALLLLGIGGLLVMRRRKSM
ncbi:PEP-CTERM sorting domain-containing protein [Undibacterium sp. TJN25]|uniref:PEP-CTERM sorting domain-containing protein n=1 Tax=Undibacterium sp. TJN25 TaxID=3413056 RepID=UPI003BF2A930